MGCAAAANTGLLFSTLAMSCHAAWARRDGEIPQVPRLVAATVEGG
jgi:hypothetical protein